MHSQTRTHAGSRTHAHAYALTNTHARGLAHAHTVIGVLSQYTNWHRYGFVIEDSNDDYMPLSIPLDGSCR
jgi:hypothetical protein